MNIRCHCWLNENEILLGIQGGFISIINKQYHLYVYLFNFYLFLNRSLRNSIESDDINCLLPFSRGVFISTK